MMCLSPVIIENQLYSKFNFLVKEQGKKKSAHTSKYQAYMYMFIS